MRWRHVLMGDMFFQRKYGFYFIYTILGIVYIAVLQGLPAAAKERTVAVLIYSDPAAMGLFFMGAIILLEKSQRVLHAVAVSPVTCDEYILSKVCSLAFISAVAAMVIGLAGGSGRLGFIILGTILSSATFTLIGIIAAVGMENLNQFMALTMVIELICFVPPVVSVFRPALWWTALSPFNASMRLIYGGGNPAADVLVCLLLLGALYPVCRGRVKRLFRRVGGVNL